MVNLPVNRMRIYEDLTVVCIVLSRRVSFVQSGHLFMQQGSPIAKSFNQNQHENASVVPYIDLLD